MTLKDLQRLKEQGLIKGWTDDTKSAEKYSHKTGKNMSTRQGDKIKTWIGKNLWAWCRANGLTLLTEVKFHPERKWKFDYAIEELKIGIEYEGLMSEKSRHTTRTGYTGDAEKYNAAQSLGWKVYRFTALNYKNMLNELNNLL